jgi:hypothetical protein
MSLGDMKSIALLLISTVTAVFAQQQSQGITPEWDIGKAITAISDHAKRLIPMIEQIDPKPWIEKGAPYAYERQLESAKAQAKAVADSAQTLARAPAKLSAAIELTYRLQALESVMGSLADGMRRYHNPAMADLVMGVLTENGANRDRLQQYVIDLAVDKETECAVANQEAQRCRGFLSRQAPATPSRASPRKK